jgi:hypothetical protein
MAEAAEEKELSSIDKVLIENLALTEEVAALRAKLTEYQILEKKMGIRQHLAKKFHVDLDKQEFSVDAKRGILSITQKA